MVGLFSLVGHEFYDDNIRLITIIFAAIAFLPLAICAIIYGGYVVGTLAVMGVNWMWNYGRYFCYIDDEIKAVKVGDPPSG